MTVADKAALPIPSQIFRKFHLIVPLRTMQQDQSRRGDVEGKAEQRHNEEQ